MKISTLIQCFFVMSLTSAVNAQENAQKHTCRILFYDAPSGAPETLYLFDGKETREVELPKKNFSPVYELPAGTLNLHLLAAPPVNPKDISSSAPKVVVPEEVSDFYLIVTSDPSNKIAPVKMQIIDAGKGKLKVGQMLWFNLTTNTVGGMLGKENFVIQPGKRVLVDAPAVDHEDYRVSLSFQIPGDENVYPLCETNWRHDPQTRKVFFIDTKPDRRTPYVMGFSDFREPAREANP